MAVFKCKMCGANLEVSENQSVVTCGYCGIYQTLPRLDSDKKIALFTRANNLRIKSEFDKAAGIYESIIAEYRDEAEAYWGLVLCKYGIEYVDDGNGSRIPTCHRTLPTSIMDDDDFNQACEYADITAKSVYRDEAKVIDKIQKKILNIALNESPYDIFICYKENDDITGERTQDSLIAQDIYSQLIKDGYKVFYSRVTLRQVAGTEYEPYIYAALSSAKVMLAIGTKHEYYDAVWVKNEWSRFISMMADDPTKALIPCYKNMDAYDMPKEFKNMQALDMGEVTFFGSLIENVKRIVNNVGRKTTKETVVINSGADDVAPLLERGYLFLEDKDFKRADEFFEAVLNKDPKNGKAYLGKLMVAFSVPGFDKLSELRLPLSGNNNYEKIMRFGDDELKASVKKCNDIIVKRNEDARIKDLYENALEIMQHATTEEMFENAGYMFLEVKDYNDAKQKSDECFEKAEIARVELEKRQELARQKAENDRKDGLYKNACVAFGINSNSCNKADIVALEESIKIFEFLGEWRDSKEKLHLCKQYIDRIYENIEKAEAERIVVQIKLKKRAKKKRLIIAAAISFVAFLMCFSIVYMTLIEPVIIYNDAIEFQENGDYAQAYDMFSCIDYKDSADRANMIWRLAKQQKLKQAQIGDLVYFGSYEQDNDLTNGKDEIEWMVLDRVDGRILVLSTFALDYLPYNNESKAVAWEGCSLREWLNKDFFAEAFTQAESGMIPTVTVPADGNSLHNTDQGNDTQDKVFLLSGKEASLYFDEDYERCCQTTLYAESKKSEISFSTDCYWWLRSTGLFCYYASCVQDTGLLDGGGYDVNSSDIFVRPAMWIEVE